MQITQPRFSLFQSHVDLRDRPRAYLYAVLPFANMDEAIEARTRLTPAAAGRHEVTGRPRKGGEVRNMRNPTWNLMRGTRNRTPHN